MGSSILCILCILLFCCFLVFLHLRFLILFLALQQAQVHRKRNSYASSMAFSNLKVLSVLLIGRLLIFLHLVLSSSILLLCFSAPSCRSCFPRQNKPKIIEIG